MPKKSCVFRNLTAYLSQQIRFPLLCFWWGNSWKTPPKILPFTCQKSPEISHLFVQSQRSWTLGDKGKDWISSQSQFSKPYAIFFGILLLLWLDSFFFGVPKSKSNDTMFLGCSVVAVFAVQQVWIFQLTASESKTQSWGETKMDPWYLWSFQQNISAAAPMWYVGLLIPSFSGFYQFHMHKRWLNWKCPPTVANLMWFAKTWN